MAEHLQSTAFDRAKALDDIAAGRAVEFTFPVLNASAQEILHFLLDTLLAAYGQPELMETLYSSLKEMIINGVKANMKHHFFVQAGVRLDSPDDIARGYELLKSSLNERGLESFETMARQHGLVVHVSLLHSPERIIGLVENNTPITEFEDTRIREKFARALGYDSLADFYMECADDVEGSGLGITMIVLLLKANGIDPHAFTINTSNRATTVARLEIPLDEKRTLERAPR